MSRSLPFPPRPRAVRRVPELLESVLKPTSPTLRCVICRRALPPGSELHAVIRGAVSAWTCSRRCAMVFFRDGAPASAPGITQLTAAPA